MDFYVCTSAGHAGLRALYWEIDGERRTSVLSLESAKRWFELMQKTYLNATDSAQFLWID